MNAFSYLERHVFLIVQDMHGVDDMNCLELNLSFQKETLRCGLWLTMATSVGQLLS